MPDSWAAVVFFAVVFSTVLQGTTIEPLARKLGLTDPAPAPQRSPIAEVGAVPQPGDGTASQRSAPE
jgi:NhaP-type Na+/H+ and K+/H+ antiporter